VRDYNSSIIFSSKDIFELTVSSIETK